MQKPSKKDLPEETVVTLKALFWYIQHPNRKTQDFPGDDFSRTFLFLPFINKTFSLLISFHLTLRRHF